MRSTIRFGFYSIVTIFCLVSHLLIPGHALSQSPFYKGKTISMILAFDPGGTADMRVKAFVAVFRKHIPGNPSVLLEYMPGGGGRKAANHVFRSAPPDGLTIGAMLGGLAYSAVLGETGVLYDLDRFVYLGSPDSATQYVLFTRRDAGLDNVEKLWSDPLRLGSFWEQVRMPGGREKGSHHGREKEIFGGIQEASSRGVAERAIQPGPAQPSA